jgi:hypothetical protein
MIMSQNRYDYVSFSKPQLDPELSQLINAARQWTPIKGHVIEHFNFNSWLDNTRQRFDFDPTPSMKQFNEGELAETILDILCLDRYRNGPKENILNHREQFIGLIVNQVKQRQPVKIVIPSFPGHPVNPLTHARIQPDLGEVASFTRLWQISEHVRTIHDPGLCFIISLDGRAYAPFCGYTPESFLPYVDDLRNVVDQLGLGHGASVNRCVNRVRRQALVTLPV